MATKRRTRKPAAPRARRVYLGKGLSRIAAWRKARARPGPDFRGMVYSSRTGYASLI